MSQIGYMIVGVSIGAYTAGIFHLMTHAFFKALLFMAAGSVIGAMADRQNIDRMARLPQGDAVHLALLIDRRARARRLPGHLRASSPRTRSSPSPPSAAACTGSSRSAATSAAFMTAFYAFRIGFRVVAGEPCEEAKELEEGHLAHGEPVNPATGEPEDTDVGFPGAEHHIAERELADEDRDGRPRRSLRALRRR